MVLARARSVVVLGSLVLAALPLGTAALAQSTPPDGGTPALEGTNWQLTALAGAADASAVPAMGANLVLQGGSASGFGGCNQFNGSYTLDGQDITFGPIASTKMACDDAKMSFESVYLGAIPTVASYAIADDTLTLLDGSGAPALTYASAGVSASAVPGTSDAIVGVWTVTQLNNGNQGVTTVAADPALAVTFGADGSVAGFGGCNQFGGPFQVAGDSIAIGPLNSTRMACGDPTDTTEQQLLAALQASTVWLVRDGTLELRDDSGALQASLGAGAPAGSPSPS